MRILMACPNYHPYHWGGLEVYVHGLVQVLLRRGHDVRIVAAAPESATHGQPTGRVHASWYTYRGERVYGVHVAPGSREENYRCRAVDLDGFWFDWLETQQFDLVHFHDVSPAASLSLMHGAARLGLPVVFTYHTPTSCPVGTLIDWRGQECDGRVLRRRCSRCVTAQRSGSAALGLLAAGTPMAMWQFMGNAAALVGERLGAAGTALQLPRLMNLHLQRLRQMIELVRLWHVHSHQIAEVLQLNGVPPKRIVMLRHGLERTDMRRPRTRAGFPDSPLRVGYLGRLANVKGIDTLLQALRRLPTGAPVEIVIHAEPQGREQVKLLGELKALAAGDARVRWAGACSREGLADALAELDLVAVPSRWVETGPLVVHEAFAAGVPVIASDLRSVRELVTPGVDGLLFRRGDASDLACQIQRVLNDPQVLARLRLGITPRVSMDGVAAQLERRYLGILDPGAERSPSGRTPSPERSGGVVTT